MTQAIEQDWMCTEPAKYVFSSRAEAKAFVRDNRRKSGWVKTVPYQCTCGKFHLTKHRQS